MAGLSPATALPRSGPLAPPADVARLVAAAPWRGGLEPSGDFECKASVRGRLPAELRGTLYRVGPGRLRIGSHRYAHWFDGDGAVTAVRLHDGGCSVSTRLVETPRVKAQRAAGEDGGFAVRGAWTQARVVLAARSVGTHANQATTGDELLAQLVRGADQPRQH